MLKGNITKGNTAGAWSTQWTLDVGGMQILYGNSTGAICEGMTQDSLVANGRVWRSFQRALLLTDRSKIRSGQVRYISYYLTSRHPTLFIPSFPFLHSHIVMALPRSAALRSSLRSATLKRTATQARTTLRDIGRRTYAQDHATKKSSDLPWSVYIYAELNMVARC